MIPGSASTTQSEMGFEDTISKQFPKKRINSPATVVAAEDLSRPEIDALLHADLDQYLD